MMNIANVAQLVEQHIRNVQVASSILAIGSGFNSLKNKSRYFVMHIFSTWSYSERIHNNVKYTQQ